jgi:sulfide dehydrogenase cytochrome subunit
MPEYVMLDLCQRQYLADMTVLPCVLEASMNGAKAYFQGLLVVLAVGLLTAQQLRADEISRATMLSVSCAGCHGTDGKSPGSIPSIGGKSSDFIATALRQFSTGEWPSTVMGRHATGYTDEEIQLIADYFAGREQAVKQ